MKLELNKILSNNNLILMEGAIVEILRRSNNYALHPALIHSPLIYDTVGADKLKSLYKGYIHIAESHKLPIIIGTPTWRANKENVTNSFIKESLNVDSVAFMNIIKKEFDSFADNILIGGIIGPKNDCYTPCLSPGVKMAEEFHAWQIDQLIKGGVDFIIAETLPNCNEALGIARAASNFGIDYIISFVISRDGKILDGTSLSDAIDRIDNSVNRLPLGYSVNCAYPSFLCAEKQPEKIFKRLIAFLGNASSLDHCDLDKAASLHVDDIAHWGEEMLRLNYTYGIKILGGCCGTDSRHIEYLTGNNSTMLR